jgi:hypothetical protein
MVKAMKEGVGSADTFANKLTDKRYAAFVSAFNFAADAGEATSYVEAQQGVANRYKLAALTAGVSPDNAVLKKQTESYLKEVAKVTSIDGLFANDEVYTYAMKAFGLEARLGDKTFMREILEGGVADPDSLANRQENKAYARFAAAFDFAARGAEATTFSNAQQGTVEKYMRQTLEENAGGENEGVRLALYFQRKAPDIKNVFDILADPALAQVVRTALGFPESMATTDVDRQAAMIKKKLDIADLQDAGKVSDFIKRFTSLWDVANSSANTQSAASVLFGQPTEFGISTSLLLTIQQMKL